MNEFLQFDKMLTPVLIKIVFWLGLGGIGLFTFVSLFNDSTPAVFKLFLLVIGAPVVSLFWRVICEQIIIFFKMHEELRRISLGQNQTNL